MGVRGREKRGDYQREGRPKSPLTASLEILEHRYVVTLCLDFLSLNFRYFDVFPP